MSKDNSCTLGPEFTGAQDRETDSNSTVANCYPRQSHWLPSIHSQCSYLSSRGRETDPPRPFSEAARLKNGCPLSVSHPVTASGGCFFCKNSSSCLPSTVPCDPNLSFPSTSPQDEPGLQESCRSKLDLPGLECVTGVTTGAEAGTPWALQSQHHS